MSKPELMSPAGHLPQLRTAIEAGADAVYFGLKHFSARAKVGFTLEELPGVMRELHARGVKGFVTFNTLVFDHELELAKEALTKIAEASVDAIIVQDIGVVKLARELAPNLEIHGSTQMSITSAQGAELAKSLGCSRVVLGRELSLKDIRKIASQTDVELEVFVHGALCVSYSGQCFSSEAWGGRSANRGKCAQACRLSYDLIVDGQQRELGASRYLLSPGDLYAIEQIPELMEIGISCVKIEGRYKDSEYVALTTKAYREAIDRAAENQTDQNDDAPIDLATTKLELEQIYSRGLGPHFMSGTNHQTVVVGRAPRHRGLKVGQVAAVGRSSVIANIEHELRPGDGVVFDAADWRSPDEPEEGGNIYVVQTQSDGKVELEFGSGEIDFSRVQEGDLIWRTRNPQLAKQLKPLTQANDPVYTRGLSLAVSAILGQPLKITAKTETGETAHWSSAANLEAAQKRGLDLEALQKQLGRLGGTPFHLTDVKFENSEPVFAPVSLLNGARRELVEQLLDARIQRSSSPAPLPETSDEAAIAATAKASTIEKQARAPSDKDTETTKLHILVRTPEQLDVAISLAPDSITLDYLELYGLKPSVAKIKDANITARVASPRILKPSEQNVVRFLLSLQCPIVVRSGGLLHDLVTKFAGQADQPLPDLIGDFSLNAANAIATDAYLDMGLAKITPTYDLNSLQIAELCQNVDPANLEVIAYSHLPVFHTEHCVFCRFLSDGTDNTNCGHPCEKHQIAVRDSQGRKHPVMADVGCRNTVFGAEAQTDPNSLASWQAAGIRNFRLEFVHQNQAEVLFIGRAFQDFFNDSISVEMLQAKLDEHSPQQTTTGSLYVPKDFKQLVQLG